MNLWFWPHFTLCSTKQAYLTSAFILLYSNVVLCQDTWEQTSPVRFPRRLASATETSINCLCPWFIMRIRTRVFSTPACLFIFLNVMLNPFLFELKSHTWPDFSVDYDSRSIKSECSIIFEVCRTIKKWGFLTCIFSVCT